MKIADKSKVKELLDFSNNNVYVMLLIARKKENDNMTNSQEIVYRKIINDEESFDRYFLEFEIIAKNRVENFRIYINFNPRNVLIAYKKLKERMSTWDYELHKQLDNTMSRIKKIDSEWISALQRSPARKNWYMIDLDNKSKIHEVEKILYECIGSLSDVYFFETKNGYNILFKPQYIIQCMDLLNNKEIECELKKDDLLCIAH